MTQEVAYAASQSVPHPNRVLSGGIPYHPPLLSVENPFGRKMRQRCPTPHSQCFSPTCADVLVFNQANFRTRVAQACEKCRSRKQKCDGGTPCMLCEEQGFVCQYRVPSQTKTETKLEKLLRHFEFYNQAFDRLTSSIDNFHHRLQHFEKHPSFIPTAQEEPQSTEKPPQIQEPPLGEHRTAPHTLIRLWPSVNTLLNDARVPYNEDYVVEAEERATLQIHSRGNRIDERDAREFDDRTKPCRGRDNTNATATATATATAHKRVRRISAATANGDFHRMDHMLQGGLKPDSSLDLDAVTVLTLFEGYLKHVHIMHPFLDSGRLRRLVEYFIDRHSTRRLAAGNLAREGDLDQVRAMKRQRLNGPTSPGVLAKWRSEHEEEFPDRNPEDAIILLILALGEICLHHGPLPRTVEDDNSKLDATALHRISGSNELIDGCPTSMGRPPYSYPPPPTQPTMSEHSSPADDYTQNHPRGRSSLATHCEARNIDTVPGLVYYAKAAEMLGHHCDGNELVHAQLFLLAGLYKGQLARVKESMSWINMAGQVIMGLLHRYKLYNHNYWPLCGDMNRQYQEGQSRIRTKQHNLIVLASWTCLQLQSDILADLRLPSSGIQSIENLLLMPLNMPEEEAEKPARFERGLLEVNEALSKDQVLIYYTSQTFLRKRLNQIQREIYGDLFLRRPLQEVCEMLTGHEETLNRWRSTLPYPLQWADSDRPPSHILNARLRAKYWGACYIINRPFLDYALHIMLSKRQGRSIRSVARDAHGHPREEAEIHLFEAIATMSENAIWHAAQRCINAAMYSTIAFDGVPGRLIVTNIHGTAHAQFGNMLVLATTYYNTWLTTLVPRDAFWHHLERTIDFLRDLSSISPTCAIDCQILTEIRKLLVGNTSTETGTLSGAVIDDESPPIERAGIPRAE